MVSRGFGSTGAARDEDAAPHCPPLTELSDEERMIQEAVRGFANDVIAPRVRAMDESATMDKDIIDGLFAQGFMGVETPAELGGTGSSFLAACLVVEELARVDPAVSVCPSPTNILQHAQFAAAQSFHHVGGLTWDADGC